ncbi:methyl-accepting chemotaxis protein [Psychromonas algicola]|uniref:methyl-accepting chemotaxis protein n=1 Tax=Psychromonas algicola TaxID=2555642 RepID=UPI001067DF4B|nr:methyl-accepting chemotaxis protein [Psychromonas sp. RZ5]TEW52237.1 HAMP domain-containing protein [Psychromonas sp. RZ5]
MLNFINNLSIRGKLLTLVTLPLIGFICFAGHDFIRTYKEKVELENMLIFCNSAATGSFLVHELQKERGASAGYLSSKGTKFKDIMLKQRLLTDQKNKELQDFIKTTPLTPHLVSIFSEINQELDKLQTVRQQIDNFSITAAEEVAFYTGLNAQLLSIIDITANDSTDPELSISAVTVGSFLQHKERAGIERAVMSNVFSIDRFTPAFLEKFIRLLAEQQSYIETFKAHATLAQLDIYSVNMTDNVLKPVQDYRDIALNKMLEGGFNTDATAWFNTITEKINKLKDVEVSLLMEMHEKNLLLISERTSSLTTLAILILFPLFFVLFLSWIITKQLQRGIHEITSKLININNDNDLTLRVEVQSKDELGDISNTINKLVQHLQGLVSKIQETSTILKTNLAENIESNHVIEGKVNSGIEQVSQVVTATTEMTSTVADIARNAMEASTETETANAKGQHGNAEVEGTIENINRLSSELNNASTIVKTLNESALNIGKFLNAVKDISDQTNLLALNAAIEAARAGESGRGFAVVADEVRSLSMQTKTSTDEIEVMIKKLQSDASSAQLAMENGINMVEKSVDDATQTGKDISEITNSIQHINQMNEQIATAAEEQSSVTEEINRNMINIQDGYTEMQASYRSLEEGCQLVDELANELDNSVGAFKIKE